ncbi:MAG: hypothetical protein EOP06_25820 [Proteobacteria bacterium]|nr:MAG: hypothetical protein EOP06_25820 [Pseudomonadota bacterium]
MPPIERDNTSVRWLRGSEKELEELLQNLCLVHFDLLTQLTLNGPSSVKWIPDTFRFSLKSDSIESESTLRFDWEWRSSNALVEILDVFLAHNRVAGVTWKGNPQGDIRGDWSYSSHVCIFDFYRQHPLSAQREQARLFLRNWLLAKASQANIEKWLTGSLRTEV